MAEQRKMSGTRDAAGAPDALRGQLYREQIWCVGSEICDLLRSCRAGLDRTSYAREQEALAALLEASHSEAEDLQALMAILRRLLEQRRTVADALN